MRRRGRDPTFTWTSDDPCSTANRSSWSRSSTRCSSTSRGQIRLWRASCDDAPRHHTRPIAVSAPARGRCSRTRALHYVGATVRHETLRFGQSWARLAPWRGHSDIAQLVIGPDAQATAHSVQHCLERARTAGYRSIVTGAVSDDDSGPFLAAGLTVHEHLHLLARDLVARPVEPDRGTARATFRDRKAIVELDDAAFEPFWRLGSAGIRDALDATPKSRMRVGRGRPTRRRVRDHGTRRRLRVPPTCRGPSRRRDDAAGDARSWPTRCSGCGSTGPRART